MNYMWMVVIGLALIAELLTGTFYLLMLAIAAGAAYLAQMTGASMLVQAICFLFTSVLACGAVFHFKRKIKTRPNPADNLDAGERVWIEDADEMVCSYRGATWKARLEDTTLEPQEAAFYRVIRIDGVVLIVAPE